MLRLAIWYENRLGRNDGNPLYVYSSLKRMQEKGLLEVDHLIPTGDLIPFGKYDAHIWVDWGEDGLKGLLPYEPTWPKDSPVIYWASDTHLGYDYRLECALKSDLVFCAQKDAVDRFRQDNVSAPVFWLPHAVEPRAYCDPSDRDGIKTYDFISKKYDVCFVGHVNSENRILMLDRLFREFPNFFYGQRLFNDAAKKYSESKAVLNISMKNDLNMRVFEVLGSQSLLITDSIPTISELFQDGKHLILYNNLDEMVDKVRYYINNPDESKLIAKSGYQEVMKNHTIDHRVDKILQEFHKLVPQSV